MRKIAIAFVVVATFAFVAFVLADRIVVPPEEVE